MTSEEDLKEKADILEMILEGHGRSPKQLELTKAFESAAEALEGSLDEAAHSLTEQEMGSEVGRLRALDRQSKRIEASARKVKETGLPVEEGDVTKLLEAGSRLHGRLESLELALEVRRSRARTGLKQSQAAAAIGISESYLSLMENARCRPPSRTVRTRVDSFIRNASSDPHSISSQASGTRKGDDQDKPEAMDWYEGKVKLYLLGEKEKSGIAFINEDFSVRGRMLRRLMQAATTLDDEQLSTLIDVALRMSG